MLHKACICKPFLLMTYFVYVLYSKDYDRYYYGQTNNLETRLLKHNSKEVSSTSKYIPWSIYAYKVCQDRQEAMKIERQLKNLKSRSRVCEFIIRKNFIVYDTNRDHDTYLTLRN
jgi:putative endonuclease